MIKLNRIGNKVGRAGAGGIVLAIGMVATQMMTESTVAGANDRADRSQRVAETTLSAHSNLREVQLMARNNRLARTPAEVDKNATEMRRFASAEANDIDAAFATALKPESKERLQKIKSLTTSYSARVEELAKTPSDLLTQIDKRTAISPQWTKAIETQLASPRLAPL